MRLRFLGTARRRVSVIGLGTMPLAIAGRPDAAAAIRVIHAALAAGMTWLDVADSYALDADDVGYGERLVGRALAEWSGPRDSILVTTKGGYVRPAGEWALDGRPEHLRAACEASLRALGVSAIPLYQLHGPDPRVYFPDSVGTLADLRREGKIEHIGLCNVDVGHLEEAAKIVSIATVQNRCNPYDRQPFSNGVIDWCERTGAAFIAHSPVGGHKGHSRIANDDALRAVAARRGVTPEQVALAWLLASSDCLLAIPGATKLESVESSARAADIVLTDAELADLQRAFPRASFAVRQLAQVRRRVRQFLRNRRAR